MGAKFLYQWEYFAADSTPKKDINTWHARCGPKVVSRKPNGTAKSVQITLLIDNPDVEVYLVGAFNDWGKTKKKEDLFVHDQHSLYATITTDKFTHKTPYKVEITFKDQAAFLLQDPAAPYFDDDGNSVFWDFEDPATYKQKHKLIDTVNRATKVLQTDLPGLIVHFANKEGICGKDIPSKEFFSFIATSGVLDEVQRLGFNTIQFLPFAQSIDGDNWKFRYLVPFQYAIFKNWGNPDDFAKMIDACHERGIAVIGDFVISHLPDRDFHVFGHDCAQNGLHQWMSRHNKPVFMGEETPWGTRRVDYDSEHVTNFIIESCLHFMKRYRVDGFRIDNVDGILRFGANGQGPERPNGRKALRKLTSTLYEYNPFALIHFEAHYFHGDNAKMLVVPFEEDPRALGATAYNSSRTTHWFHKKYMIYAAEAITLWSLRNYIEEKEWGQSNACIADFHNHDAAAGLMHERATGSYAYDAMMQSPGNHIHAVGKIKTMEAYISFCMEGRTLDLLQTFLLQSGTFEHDSSIQWFLTYNDASEALMLYKQKINAIMDNKAFWPCNVKNRRFLNIDDNNKVIVVERESDTDSFVIVINLSSWRHHAYKVGLRSEKDYEVIFNSDRLKYAGFGIISYPNILKNTPSTNFEVLDREVILDMLPPYSVVVLRRIK